jgi:hypothetical protein
MKIMTVASTVLALGATSLALPAQAQYPDFGRAQIYPGEVDQDNDTGAWECEIRCGGLLDFRTILGYRFVFWNGTGYQPTQWIPDGGQIACNPFQDFEIGAYYSFAAPVACEVALD